ncbi:MAG: osmotically inducible protein C [Spirochaetae bacterium HGW-Spirochaetae-3]|nr:MAG: osmotically inducible protein C [Spirochaetae bacterium HGW-Spirochaetae-3]
MNEISCVWKGDMAFIADVNGHKIVVDADDAFGGKDEGPRPKPLVLAALAGCSGMDVVSVLKKMREPVSWFNMRVQGELAEDHPKIYTSIKIIYEFKASDGLKDESVRKAVDLSQDRYCGVAALLRMAIPLEYEIAYL